LRPDVHETDGFFAAIFERKKNLVLEAVNKASEKEVEVLVEAVDVLEPEAESETKPETKPKTKAVKTPAKKRIKPQKVELSQPDLDSDHKDA
jgi:16S rRNA (cytosine967-C5)-methyltransferase